jgi:hypothetical protein
MPGDRRDRVSGYQYDAVFADFVVFADWSNSDEVFPHTTTPARRRSAGSGAPTEKATVADIMLAYRLILKREADPAGLAAYSQRVNEGLTLEELLQ